MKHIASADRALSLARWSSTAFTRADGAAAEWKKLVGTWKVEKAVLVWQRTTTDRPVQDAVLTWRKGSTRSAFSGMRRQRDGDARPGQETAADDHHRHGRPEQGQEATGDLRDGRRQAEGLLRPGRQGPADRVRIEGRDKTLLVTYKRDNK